MATTFYTSLVISLLTGDKAYAKAVISEVHWAGSDLSTSDEWVEISGVQSAGDDEVTTMSGWTLTSVNSSGVENVIFRFPSSAEIHVDQYLVVSHFPAAQSRLLAEPAFAAGSITLPNSKLLLRLRDQNGQVVDQVDDGVGEPFAGENMSSPVRKSSMERVSLSVSGTDPSNWMTSAEFLGWDDGFMAMHGTPGFARSTPPPQTPSGQGEGSSGSASSSSSSQMGTPALVSSSSSSPSSCIPLDPYFIIQSGSATGVGKVTLNIQIGTRTGSVTGAVCTVDFDDGTSSASCNPPSHTYDEPGSYTISAEVKNSCGTTVRTMPVEVTPKDGATSTPSASGGQSVNDDIWAAPEATDSSSHFPFVLSAVLPNPEGKDPGKEWVEITNVSPQTASLEGWILRLPHAKKGKYTFGSVGFAVRESKRFLSSELGMTFGNDAGELSLLYPSGQTASVLPWNGARDGVVIRPQRNFSGTARARVTHVIDGDTVDVSIVTTGGSEVGGTERVRMIGIDAPELHASDARQRMLAKRATEFLRSLLEGSIVTLTGGADARDAYGRLLAYVATEENDSVQEMILREGLASVYLRYAFAKEAEFIGYQREAQEVNAGMWGVVDAGKIENARLPDGQGELKIENNRSSTPVAAGSSEEASVRSRVSEIVHLEKSSSSGKSSSSKKKSSAAPKRTVATKKPTAVVAVVRENSSASTANFSPLQQDASQAALSADLLSIQDLIEHPDDGASSSAEVVPSVEEPAPPSLPVLPLISLGVAVSGAASGAAGWFLASRRGRFSS